MSNNKLKSKYRNRWNVDRKTKRQLRKLLKFLNKKKTKKITEENTPFGMTEEGRIDLRGLYTDLQLPESVNKTFFENVDLSYSHFDRTIISDCYFKNTLLSNVTIEYCGVNDPDFINTNFINCNFNHTSFGSVKSKMLNCKFENVNFKNGTIMGEIDYSTFKNCNFKGVDLAGASFVETKFIGKVEDAWFRGTFPHKMFFENFGTPRKNEMKNVSFEHAELIDITFSNDCDLSSVIMPIEGNYIRFDKWLNRLKFAEREINGWKNSELKKGCSSFLWVYSGHAKTQDWHILNVDRSIMKYGDKVMSVMIDLLSKYE